MRKTTLLFAIILLFIFQSQAQRWYGYDENENQIGTRSMAAGGTGVATIGGINALYWNPANIAKTKKGFQVNAELGLRFGLQNKDDETTSESITYYQMPRTLAYDNFKNIGVAYVFNINHVKVGLAAQYRQMYDWSYLEVVAWEGNDDFEYANFRKRAGGSRLWSYGLSIWGTPNFRIGISTNYLKGKSNYTRTLRSGNYVYTPYMSTEYDNSSEEYVSEYVMDATAFSEIGIAYSPFEFLDLGFKFNTRYTESNELTITVNDGITAYDNSLTTNYIPMFYVFGASINLTDATIFKINYNSKNWANVKEDIGTADPDFPYSDFSLSNYRYGIEFRDMYDNYFSMGYYKKKYLYRDIYNNQLKGHTFTFGWGATEEDVYTWGVGVSMEYISDRQTYTDLSIKSGMAFTINSDFIIYF